MPFTSTSCCMQAQSHILSSLINSSCCYMQVENRAALYNFASIATAADGVVISRGNLGLDVLPEKMALVQKDVVSKCNLLGKPVIITRVVDTMATAPRPTRYPSPGLPTPLRLLCHSNPLLAYTKQAP